MHKLAGNRRPPRLPPQCGGKEKNPPFAPWDKDHHHQTCCPKSFYCAKQDDYYSQCL